jgi:amino acid transporter
LPQEVPTPDNSTRGIPAWRKLGLLQLIGVTYFMVCGGPYGLEDLVKNAGYTLAIVVLMLTPLLWSLPTALMVGELSAALPHEGGFCVWVRRALGPFWGMQAAWLAFANSIVDMAAYPALFVEYLARVWPALGDGHAKLAIGLAVIGACTVLNLLGARVVGRLSVVMTVVLLSPFAVLTVLAFAASRAATVESPPAGSLDLMAGVLLAMWSFSGWEESSTIAGEVERPQRTYPLVMLGALVCTTLSYLLPVLAAARLDIDPSIWKTGAWVDVAQQIGGPVLATLVLIGGLVSAFGIFNSLALAYTRLPLVLADDGYLPAILRRRHRQTGSPWVCILACAAAWAFILPFGFERLVVLDVLLYGLCLVLEFITLVVLRFAEPKLVRPFRVPGGKLGAILLGVGPMVLLAAAFRHELFRDRTAEEAFIDPLQLGGIFLAIGPVLYLLSRWRRRHSD